MIRSQTLYVNTDYSTNVLNIPVPRTALDGEYTNGEQDNKGPTLTYTLHPNDLLNHDWPKDFMMILTSTLLLRIENICIIKYYQNSYLTTMY